MPESITCPVCGTANWGPNEKGERICGYCNRRIADPIPDRISAAEAGQPPELHLVDVEIDEWSSIPSRLRPIERPRP